MIELSKSFNLLLTTLFSWYALIFIIMEKERKIQQLQENLFATIAKILAFNALKRNLGTAKELTKGDQELQGSLETLKYHTQRLEKLLKDVCKRDPLNWRCKEYAKNQKDKSPNFK